LRVRVHTKHAFPLLRRPAVTAPCRANVTAASGATKLGPSWRSHPKAPASPMGRFRRPLVPCSTVAGGVRKAPAQNIIE
jgi:hypothetical protein